MMLSILLFFVLGLPLATASAPTANDPDFSIVSIPSQLLENANTIVRLERMEFDVKSVSKATMRYRYVVTLMNSNSQQSLHYVSYDKMTKVKKIKGRLLNAMGQEIRKIGKDEIHDISAVSSGSIYEDDRMKYMEFKHDTYPYTIDFEYEVEKNGLQGYPDWRIQGYNMAVQQASYVLRLPAEMQAHYRAYNCDLMPQQTVEGKDQRLEWSVKDLAAVKAEAYAPLSTEILPSISVTPAAFEVAGYKGSMSSWKAFGDFIYRLNEGRDALSPKMAAQVKSMVVDASTDAERINILYRYLQDNMRYVSVQLGIGGWQTFDAEYVEKNKYGDCKALSYFMRGMLRTVGIESHTVLVRAGQHFGKVEEDFVEPRFNHMILYIPSEDMWLECTSNSALPNYLGNFTSGRPVLLVTGEGGQLSRTPKISAEADHCERRALIELAIDGSATISTEEHYKGPCNDRYRMAWEDYDEEKRQKAFVKDHKALPAFDIKALELTVEKERPEAQLDYQLAVRRYAAKAGKRIFVPLNRLRPFDQVPSASGGRLHPVVVRKAFSEENHFKFKLPEGYEIESIPEKALKLDTEFGTYELQIEQQEEALSYTRSLVIKPVKLPAERYGELRDFYKKITKMDKMKVVLVKKKT
ncbi:MAG: DUF3857 and transglutaminase domain-containing protein [Bacteroidota bacterium]